MKTIILITLFIVLLPLSVIGQNDIKATLSYNKSNSTLTVDIKNISDKVVMIHNQSRHSPTIGSSVELGYKGKNGVMGYHLVPLANESTNYLWNQLTEMNPLEKRSCIFSESIKFFMGDRILVCANIYISYSFIDFSGRRIYSRYENTLTIE